MFNIGQRVVVLGAYAGGSPGVGTIVKLGQGKLWQGKYWVDLGDAELLPVEPERLIDAVEYYRREREKFEKYSKE